MNDMQCISYFEESFGVKKFLQTEKNEKIQELET